MARRLNWRLALVLALLLLGAARQVAREQRPSLLRPDLRMHAYVAGAAVTVVDLVGLAVVAEVDVGPEPSGVAAHPTRAEVWGVSAGGYAWVLDARTNAVVARIPVGAVRRTEGGLDVSPDGTRAYVAAGGRVVAVDCARREVAARSRAQHGERATLVRVTPDGKTVLALNREDASVSLLDASTLEHLATLPVAGEPVRVAILPDSAKAFVAAADTDKVTVIDLRERARQTGGGLAHLPVGGPPADMVLKPDGGELYLPVPAIHGLVVVNTWTNEVGDSVLAGDTPVRGVLTADAETLYVSDAAAGQVTPIRIPFRQVQRPIPAGSRPGVMRLTPGEDLLLAVNEASGDLAVIRTRTGSLLTLLPVGPAPRELAVKVF
jgi:YVTN family beta-propeller protein